MQSKHVINGASQPALFVVQHTLESNVSTMGGRKAPGTAEVLTLAVSAAQKSFILPSFSLSANERSFCSGEITLLLFYNKTEFLWCCNDEIRNNRVAK